MKKLLKLLATTKEIENWNEGYKLGYENGIKDKKTLSDLFDCIKISKSLRNYKCGDE